MKKSLNSFKKVVKWYFEKSAENDFALTTPTGMVPFGLYNHTNKAA